MSGATTPRLSPAVREPVWVRLLLIGVAVAFLGLLVVVPLVVVFQQALARGPVAWLAAIQDAETLAALQLTLLTACISVTANLAFGLAAAWLIARYDFVGKRVLSTLIDLPFSVSPVLSGLIFVLLFGRQGLLGPWLSAHDVRIIFAVPGVVLATTFVTFPFVAKEVLPLMQAPGSHGW